MTDEEYGRAWAGQTGRRPSRYDEESGRYVWTRGGGAVACDVPVSVFVHLWSWDHRAFYPDEGSAYKALGRAVRKVLVEVPQLNQQGRQQ